MAVYFECSVCGEDLEAPDCLVNDKLACPVCGNEEVVPAPGAQLSLICAKRHLEKTVPYFLKYFGKKMRLRKPNLFIIAADLKNRKSVRIFDIVKQSLGGHFEAMGGTVRPSKVGLEAGQQYDPSVVIVCFAVDSGAPELVRDILKKSLFEFDARSARYGFRLRKYGLFVPSIRRKYKGTITHSFAHGEGLYYQYRLAPDKAKRSPLRLRDYLFSMLEDCPNHFFQRGPRVSTVASDKLKVREGTRNHPIIDLCRVSFGKRMLKNDHSNVEKYFIVNDPMTIAAEVPVWVRGDEAGKCKDIVNIKDDEVLTGHIDLIRNEDSGKISVWDYKPGAYYETCAATQVFLYSVMLSIRTRAPLEQFKCGYFDAEYACFFSPFEVWNSL
jgi:hypothetical protein